MVPKKGELDGQLSKDFILFCRDDKEGCCFCWRKSAGQVLNEIFDADNAKRKADGQGINAGRNGEQDQAQTLGRVAILGLFYVTEDLTNHPSSDDGQKTESDPMDPGRDPLCLTSELIRQKMVES
jgi:hypothetical protein